MTLSLLDGQNERFLHIPLVDPLFASSNLDFSNLHFSLRLFSIPEIKFSLTLTTTELSYASFNYNVLIKHVQV